MGIGMGTAALIGGLASAGAGIAANVQQNKARRQAQEQMRQAEENFGKDLEARKTQFETQMSENARIHGDNLAAMQKAHAADEARYKEQLAQSERGLQLQQQSMQEARGQADRALNNQKAQLERQINMDSANVANFSQSADKQDKGVAGTILTGPGGVLEEEMKKQKKTLLGQ